MLLRFPNEILQAIFNHSTNDDLYRLIRVNHLIFDIAICLLYRSIPRMSVPRSTDCLTSLLLNDTYASLVRSISVEWSSVSLKRDTPNRNTFRSIVKYGVRALSQRRILQDRITLLNTCLRKLHNLTILTLSFNIRDSNSDETAHRILSGCSFTLSRFSTSLACQTAVVQFLEAQPGLSSLNLAGAYSSDFDTSQLEGKSLSATALPNLKSMGWTITVPCELVRHFIRGRPIQRINATLNHQRAMQVVDLLLLSTCPIDSAIFKFGAGVEVLSLPYIADKLPDLRLLKISLDFLPSVEVLQDMSTSLARLHKLKCLIFFVKRLDSIDLLKYMREVFRNWFHACPTLSHVDLPQCGRNVMRRKRSSGSAGGIETGIRIRPIPSVTTATHLRRSLNLRPLQPCMPQKVIVRKLPRDHIVTIARLPYTRSSSIYDPSF